MEILEYESILTVLLHIGMDLIDREDVGKGETIQLYILVKDFKHVGIRSFEPPGDGNGRIIQIPECKHDQHI